MTGAVDIGHGVEIVPMHDETTGAIGLYWRHPGCRAWFYLWFRPDPRSTGHELVAGDLDHLKRLTVRGSLACPKGCAVHGEIVDGRWKPC